MLVGLGLFCPLLFSVKFMYLDFNAILKFCLIQEFLAEYFLLFFPSFFGGAPRIMMGSSGIVLKL